MLDRKAFVQVMTGLCELLGRPGLSKPALEMYYRALSDLTTDQFHAAADRIVRNRKFTNLPVPADFREGLVQGVEDRALASSEVVLRKMRSAGGDADVAFEDPVLMAAVHLAGGWPFLCDYVNSFDLEKLGIWKREFAALYRTAATRNLQPPPVLLGRHSQRNVALGYLNPATGELKNAEGDTLRIMPWGSKQIAESSEVQPEPLNENEHSQEVQKLISSVLQRREVTNEP